MVVEVMMDVKPQTQRIQMIKPHRQCLRTEMPPSDHTAKDIALNGLNRKDDASKRIEPQKTRLPKGPSHKGIAPNGSIRKAIAPNRSSRKRHRPKRIKPQRQHPKRTKTVPPQKEPFWR
jgi:hypothetical protein